MSGIRSATFLFQKHVSIVFLMSLNPTPKKGNDSKVVCWRHPLGTLIFNSIRHTGGSRKRLLTEMVSTVSIDFCLFFIWVCRHQKFGESPERTTGANLNVYLCWWNAQKFTDICPVPLNPGLSKQNQGLSIKHWHLSPSFISPRNAASS